MTIKEQSTWEQLLYEAKRAIMFNARLRDEKEEDTLLKVANAKPGEWCSIYSPLAKAILAVEYLQSQHVLPSQCHNSIRSPVTYTKTGRARKTLTMIDYLLMALVHLGGTAHTLELLPVMQEMGWRTFSQDLEHQVSTSMLHYRHLVTSHRGVKTITPEGRAWADKSLKFKESQNAQYPDSGG